MALPSGLSVTLYDVIHDEGAPVARFRFLLPQIAPEAGALPFDALIDDLAFLCESVALPQARAAGHAPEQIVVSVSAVEVPFGQISADVTQYFQPYAVDGDRCIWEDF